MDIHAIGVASPYADDIAKSLCDRKEHTSLNPNGERSIPTSGLCDFRKSSGELYSFSTLNASEFFPAPFCFFVELVKDLALHISSSILFMFIIVIPLQDF